MTTLAAIADRSAITDPATFWVVFIIVGATILAALHVRDTWREKRADTATNRAARVTRLPGRHPRRAEGGMGPLNREGACWEPPPPPDPRSFRHMTPESIAEADATLVELIARHTKEAKA